jgi:anti-anti-sigma regulatory factor
MATVRLQDIRSDLSGFRILSEFAYSCMQSSDSEIIINMSDVHWIDAHMSAPMGVLFAQLKRRGRSTRMIELQPSVQEALIRNSFLTYHDTKSSTVNDQSGGVIPFRHFEVLDDVALYEYLSWLFRGNGLPEMSNALQSEFQDNVFEIFANAKEHSETSMGVFACGQAFPRDHRFDFCIADAGIGFRNKIAKEIGREYTSVEAICWAVQERNTVRKHSPGGLGLKLLKEFIFKNGGSIQIVSEDGYWNYRGGIEDSCMLGFPFPGTFVNLEINTADKQSYRLKTEATEND